MAELELRHLRLVCAIADKPSLTRAAARLGVSQPSLSASLQRIEQRVGGRLFERARTGTRTTELGAYLVGSARTILADMEHLLAGAAARTSRAGSELRIGACPGPIGPALSRSMTDALPTAAVTLQVAGTSRLAHDLADHRLDFALLDECVGFPLRTGADIDTRQLVEEPVFVALPEQHPLAGHRSVALGDLFDEDWVLPPMRDSNDQVVLAHACAAAGFRPRIRHEATEQPARRALVAAGAVALAQPTSRSGRGVVVRPLRDDPIMLERVLAWNADGRHAVQADTVYRHAARAYLAQLDGNPDYRIWWASNPTAHRQLCHAVEAPPQGRPTPGRPTTRGGGLRPEVRPRATATPAPPGS